MASQQVLIAETIRSMKLAVKRRAEESDSDDDTIAHHTNRGNKLKRKAHNIREGRLDTTGGQSYRKLVNHAGYDRYIIHKNPLIYDYDGDLVDPEMDLDEHEISPAEDNPFQDIKLEELLMPLTSPGELASHPALSTPYTARHISEMAENVQEMLHRERETLTQMKSLLADFRGDSQWVPLEALETAQDHALLEADGLDMYPEMHSVKTAGSTVAPSVDDPASAIPLKDSHTKSNGVKTQSFAGQVRESHANGVDAADMANNKTAHTNGNMSHEATKDPAAGTGTDKDDASTGKGFDNANAAPDQKPPGAEQTSDMDSDSGPSHAMTTRAKARTPPLDEGRRFINSETASSVPAISAFFLAPISSLPDQTVGLPIPEAEETRRALLLYVQKQEEVVRGLEQLCFGLLKADRRRKEVWKWCKAEPHVGEMSDGEDWYDKEEWALGADLVKGKEEEEVEDENKRRGRRREGKGRREGGA